MVGSANINCVSILEKFRSLGNVLQYLAGLDTKVTQLDRLQEYADSV